MTRKKMRVPILLFCQCIQKNCAASLSVSRTATQQKKTMDAINGAPAEAA